MIDKAFKYRIYPTKSQKEFLSRTFGCVRVIWNACVESFNSYDKELNPIPKMPGKLDLVEEKPWLNEVSAATLQQKQRDFIEFSKQYFSKSRKKESKQAKIQKQIRPPIFQTSSSEVQAER